MANILIHFIGPHLLSLGTGNSTLFGKTALEPPDYRGDSRTQGTGVRRDTVSGTVPPLKRALRYFQF
jgi:hypothetical protein